MKVLRSILAAAALVVCALPLRAEPPNGISAIVDVAVITSDDVEILTSQTMDVLYSKYRTQPEVLAKKVNESRGENLGKLLDRQLILHDFKVSGYNLPESVIDELVQERIKNRYGNRMTLAKTLQEQGVSYDKFRQQIRDQFIVEIMRQKNVSSEVIISPHKVEIYYLAHQNDFKLEDEVKLRMIVLNKAADPAAPQATRLAEEILAKLGEGASFSEMATVYSQGSQRKDGGQWGWVERSVLRPELATVAFTLKPGQRSGLIETPEACYLMLVEDTRLAHVKPLGEVRDQIEKELLTLERTRLENQWIERLKKKTFVRYF